MVFPHSYCEVTWARIPQQSSSEMATGHSNLSNLSAEAPFSGDSRPCQANSKSYQGQRGTYFSSSRVISCSPPPQPSAVTNESQSHDLLVATFQMLRSQACATMHGLCGAGIWTSGFVHASILLSYSSSPCFLSIWFCHFKKIIYRMYWFLSGSLITVIKPMFWLGEPGQLL